MKSKEPASIRAAKITGDSTIKAAKIGAIGAIIAAIIIALASLIKMQNKNTENPEIVIESFENSIQDSNNFTIPSILPDIEKFHPQEAYNHNSNAKKLLDRIISMNDKDIQVTIDMVINELDKSHEIDDEFGETYYFYGVAYYKKGDYYVAINDFSKAVTAYNDSLYHFDKSESFYSHISNTYFDKGKTYIALGDIYKERDRNKSRDYYQKAIDCCIRQNKYF